jgi:RNA polymerase sigma-70 factor (ECF subfamily)
VADEKDSVLERARSGDREAFDVLGARVVDRLYCIARLVLRDSDRAEDAVQEALVRCWRDLPKLRDLKSFDNWLCRLLTHAITDEFRVARRLTAKVQLLPHASAIADSSEDVARRDQLERGFSRLSVEHRTVIVLRYYSGLSVEETAAALGTSIGTAKSRNHYALEALRAALEADARPARSEAAS